MLYRTSNRVLNNGIKVIILICMDGTSQYHHHRLNLGLLTINSDGKGASRMFSATVPGHTHHFFFSDWKLRSWWWHTCDINILSIDVLHQWIFPHDQCSWFTWISDFFTVCRTNRFRSFWNERRYIRQLCIYKVQHEHCCWRALFGTSFTLTAIMNTLIMKIKKKKA